MSKTKFGKNKIKDSTDGTNSSCQPQQFVINVITWKTLKVSGSKKILRML